MKVFVIIFLLLFQLIPYSAECKYSRAIRLTDEIRKLAKKSRLNLNGLDKSLDKVPLNLKAHFIKCGREIPNFINVVCRNEEYIKLVCRYPTWCTKAITKTLSTMPGKPTLNMLNDVYSIRGADRVVKDLMPNLTANEIRQLNNAIGGKTFSSDSIQSILNKSKNLHIPSSYRGELFELIGAKVLGSGRTIDNLPLMKNSKIISGQFNHIQNNQVHGIDKIGISPDGKPILIEMGINKDFGKTLTRNGVQMSPQWCAANWKKFITNHPEKVNELVTNGMNPKYRNSFKEADFVNDDLFLRKVCLPKDGELKGLIHTGLNGKGRLKETDIIRL